MKENENLPDLESLRSTSNNETQMSTEKTENIDDQKNPFEHQKNETTNTDLKSDKEIFKKLEKDESRNKKVIILSLLLLLVLGIIVSLFFFNPFGGEQKVGDKNEGSGVVDTNNEPKPTKTVDPNATNANNEPEDKTIDKEFWLEDGKKYPIKLADWQLKAYDDPTVDQKPIHNYTYIQKGFSSDLENLPSRASGYTDDTEKVTLEDGTINPLYSYWTVEGFNESIGIALQRFINPEFGKWAPYQYPEMMEYADNPDYLRSEFNDVFDPIYFTEMADTPVKEWIPIYADWDKNNYGMEDQILSNGPRWMGSLENIESEFTYNQAQSDFEVKVTADVVYNAWGQDESKMTKKGVITFDVTKGPENNRYLISNAKLEMKE